MSSVLDMQNIATQSYPLFPASPLLLQIIVLSMAQALVSLFSPVPCVLPLNGAFQRWLWVQFPWMALSRSGFISISSAAAASGVKGILGVGGRDDAGAGGVDKSRR